MSRPRAALRGRRTPWGNPGPGGRIRGIWRCVGHARGAASAANGTWPSRSAHRREASKRETAPSRAVNAQHGAGYLGRDHASSAPGPGARPCETQPRSVRGGRLTCPTCGTPRPRGGARRRPTEPRPPGGGRKPSTGEIAVATRPPQSGLAQISACTARHHRALRCTPSALRRG